MTRSTSTLKQTSAARGKDILDASEKGLVKAAEYFLRKDPKCMEMKDADRTETWALESRVCRAPVLLWRSELTSGLLMYAGKFKTKTSQLFRSSVSPRPLAHSASRSGSLGHTPLQLAVKEDRTAVVEMLLGRGACIEATSASAGPRTRTECRDLALKRREGGRFGGLNC